MTQTNESPKSILRVLLLDDDPTMLKMMRLRVKGALGAVEIETATEPAVRPGFDVYVIDNEFPDGTHGGLLAWEARRLSPDALILAYSGRLDRETLMQLINFGCNGAYDKTQAEAMTQMFSVIADYRLRRSLAETAAPAAKPGLIRELRGLLSDWSSQLRYEESRQT